MNILWDLRLFSYGYRDRGVGVYCGRVAVSIVKLHPDITLFAWGDRRAVSAELRDAPITWIDYRGGGWKSSVVMLPLLALRYRIDLVHYWVALGPLRQIGMAPFNGSKTVATVYDLGVELWNTPFGNRMKTEKYWSMQKRFFGIVNGIVAISNATIADLRQVFPAVKAPCERVLPPLTGTISVAASRDGFFITLGGAIHKNSARVVAAFAKIRRVHPDYRLIVLGMLDMNEEGIDALPDGVVHEPSMANYEAYLQRASGLLFCSLHEGLGLPPLDAMQAGCPLVLADIPSLRETCGDAGLFVDPCSVESIADGIGTLIDDNETWADRSRKGAQAYRLMSADAPLRCLRLYEHLTGVKIGRRCQSDGTLPEERR